MALAVICTAKTNAQHAMGLQMSGRNAPYSTFLNPANAYPDRNMLYLNAWGTNLGFTNNFVRFNMPERAGYLFQHNGLPVAFKQDFIAYDGSDNNKLYYLKETYGPSAFFRVSPYWGLGFGVRAIGGLSMTGVGQELGNLIRYGVDTSKGAFSGAKALQMNKTYTNGKFSVSAENYQEWFMSLANVSGYKGNHFWKWGATGKLLLGMGSANYASDNLGFGFNNGNQMYFENSNIKTAHTDDESASTVLDNPFGLNFKNVNGAGLGFDVGFVYEKRIGNRGNNYMHQSSCFPAMNKGYSWKFGASLTDIGFIAWDGHSYDYDIKARKNWNVNRDLVNLAADNSVNTDRFDKVDTGFSEKFGATRYDGFSTVTPMAFNAQLDIRFQNSFYVGANWTHSLKGQSAMGLRRTSYLSVVPRWEKEHAEFGIPVTLTRDYTALNVGMYGRLGPLIVGTDNLGGLYKYAVNNDYQSANIYMALRFKLALCPYNENFEELDTVTTYDTIPNKVDTLSFYDRDTLIKRDTIKVIERDTVYRTIRDTVYKYSSGPSSEEIRKREDAVKRREAEVLKREADAKNKSDLLILKEEQLRLREIELSKSSGSDCNKRIKELQDELDRTRTQYATLERNCKTCTDEKAKCELKIKDLENEIIKLKAEVNNTRLDNTRLKTENDNLKAEIVRLKMSTINPCDKQTKTLDSLLTIEKKKNTDLKVEVEKLKTENDAIKKQKAELEVKVADDSKKLSDLQAQLDALGKENTNLKNQLKNTTGCDALKAQVATLEKELETTKNNLKAEVEKNKTLEEKLKSTEDCGPYKTKIAELEKRYSELQTEYNFLLNQNKELQASLKACESTKTNSEEITRLKAEVETLKKTVTDLEAKLADTEKQKKTVETDNTSLKAEVESLKKQLTTCQTNLSNCEKTSGSGSGEVNTLKAEVETLKTKLSTAEGKLADSEKLRKTLETDNGSLKAEVEDLKKQLTTCQTNLSNCEKTSGSGSGEVNTLKAEVESLKTKLSSAETKLADCEKQKKTEETENTSLKAQIENNKKQITNLEAQLADAEAKLKACQASSGNADELNKLKADVERLKSELSKCEESKSTYQAEVSKLKQQVEGLQSKVDDCDNKIAAKNTEINTLKAQLETANGKISTLQTQLNECKANSCDCSGLKADITEWQNKYNSMKDQYDQLMKEYQMQGSQMQTLRTELNETKAALKACQEK